MINNPILYDIEDAETKDDLKNVQQLSVETIDAVSVAYSYMREYDEDAAKKFDHYLQSEGLVFQPLQGESASRIGIDEDVQLYAIHVDRGNK